MICDKCNKNIDEKWMHYIQDNTFCDYAEDTTPNYIFCNNCWDTITNNINKKREQEIFLNHDVSEEYKNGLYPHGSQPEEVTK